MRTLEACARELLESVQAAWEEDLRWSAWLASEGERVRDNAQALVEAAPTATLRNLVGDTTVHEYLGYSWLEVHSMSKERADALQAVLDSAGH
ncbi:hypothetical protein [Lysobacter arvi]|uniref:Uncharacterized protein n=1 Tax=Lysobacter arvi TaxID=3038776 RepID=A0ABU1C9R7_9GAMM|nr:hypothetical protein [Lysobacter arvi]MDR0181936.1 hypothetical protein [Lysobacter arvi]